MPSGGQGSGAVALRRGDAVPFVAAELVPVLVGVGELRKDQCDQCEGDMFHGLWVGVWVL